MLGRAESVKITKENTTIVNGKGNKKEIEDRVNQIKAQIEETTSEFDAEKNYKKDLQTCRWSSSNKSWSSYRNWIKRKKN